MKRILIILSLWSFLCPLWSQDKTWTDTLVEKISRVFYEEQIKFYGLDSAKLPYGIILNKAIFSKSDFSLFDGAKCNYADCYSWSEIYNDLAIAQLYKQIIDTLPIDTTIVRATSENLIPLGLIDVFYSQFKDNAFQDKMISVSDSFFVDNTTGEQSAYEVKRLLVFSPLIVSSAEVDKNFYLDPDLYVSNNPNKIKKIEIDFGDGNGYQAMNIGDYRKVNYAFEDTAFLKIKITYENEKQSYAYTELFVSNTYNNSVLKGLSENTINYYDYLKPKMIWFLTDDSRAYIQTPYIDHANKIRRDKVFKPIIFVEGLNFKPADDKKCPGCIENAFRYGTLGYDIVRSGFDPAPNEWDKAPVAKAPQLIERLQYDGYDFIYLDFKDGAGSIDHNSDILVELIMKINAELKANGSNHPINILSVSMGGIISRIALSKLEKDPSVNYEHNVRNWVSFDSPHNGANIPLSVQYLLQDLQGIPGVSEMWTNINKDAPKELMFAFMSDNCSPLRTTMLSSPNYSFPQKTFNIGISNGSFVGTELPNMPGKDVVSVNMHLSQAFVNLLVPISPFNYNIYMNLRSVGVQSTVYSLKINIENPTLSEYIRNYEKTSSLSVPWDNMPGGIRKSFKSLGSQIPEINLEINVPEIKKGCIKINNTERCAINTPPIHFKFLVSDPKLYYESHCFIPATSAMAMSSGYAPNTQLNQVFASNSMYVNKANAATPFDVIYASPDRNQGHCEITDENGQFIINLISPDNAMVQNTSLKGVYENRSSSIFGKSVNIQNPNIGDAYVMTGNKTEIYAGEKVVFKDGFKVMPGGDLKVKIVTMPAEPQILPALKDNMVSFKLAAGCVEVDTSMILYPPKVKHNSVSKDHSISVFPLPAKDFITISGLSDYYKIELLSLTGTVLYAESLASSAERQVDVSSYSSGIYFIRCYNNRGDVVVKKVLIE